MEKVLNFDIDYAIKFRAFGSITERSAFIIQKEPKQSINTNIFFFRRFFSSAQSFAAQFSFDLFQVFHRLEGKGFFWLGKLKLNEIDSLF